MKIRTLTLSALLLVLGLPAAPPAQAAGSLSAYRGLGAWVDIYDPAAWRRPGRVVARLADRGVRTLYLETNNYHSPGKIRYPEGTGTFIDKAHARGLKIVGWYLPGLRNLKRDRRRSLAAIRFRSPNGGRFDSFALDIESSLVKKVSRRNRKLLRLSRFLRRKVGGATLGAIIPSPRGMELSPSYWPRFPYAQLADRYDVFLTMTYYSYRTKGGKGVTDYMRRSIDILRTRTGDPDIPIHAIGGLANASSAAESRAFVRSVREHGLLGGSLYDDSIMGTEDWAEVTRIQPNPLQSPAMPFAAGVHTGAYGNVPGADRSHPDEVVYRVGPRSGDLQVTYEGFDLDADEVDLQVNWTTVATLPPGLADDWSGPAVVVIPSTALDDDRKNVIAFVPRARHPSWPEWGVREVSIQSLGP
ncbi:MAG TPA: hypothetical protein VGB28_02000 [Actinomycetota bacterium]